MFLGRWVKNIVKKEVRPRWGCLTPGLVWVCDHDGTLRLVAPEKILSLWTFGFCDLNVKVFLTSPPSFCTILSWNKSQVDFQLWIFIQMGCEMRRGSLRAIFGSSTSHKRASLPGTLSSQLWNWIISLETIFQATNPYRLHHSSSTINLILTT